MKLLSRYVKKEEKGMPDILTVVGFKNCIPLYSEWILWKDLKLQSSA